MKVRDESVGTTHHVRWMDKNPRFPLRWLKRTGGWAAEPTGKLTADMDPKRNFGAEVL